MDITTMRVKANIKAERTVCKFRKLLHFTVMQPLKPGKDSAIFDIMI